MVLAGIECSPKICDFRASGIPVQERVDFFDTLTVRLLKLHGVGLSINFKISVCGGNAAFSVFPVTCAAEKHLVSEKPLNNRFQEGTGVSNHGA